MQMLVTRRRRLLVAPAVLALVLLLPACGGGGGSNPPGPNPVTASFTPSGTASTPDLVRLTEGSKSGSTVTVNVVLAGPTTSSDIYSFAFDLLIGDTSVAAYIDGSVTAGTMLTPSGGQGVTAQAAQSGDKVVVGITLTGGGSGNGVGAAEPVVVSLTFRLLKVGSSTLAFAGPPSPAPAALDSVGATIGSITFDATSASLNGS